MPRGYSSEGYYGGARPIFSTMLGTWQVTSDDCAVSSILSLRSHNRPYSPYFIANPDNLPHCCLV